MAASGLARLLNARILANSFNPWSLSWGISAFHASSARCDLMEFFDDKTKWGSKEVRSGRSWTRDELRIKSNVDLHKLWFVLYKEKNMLLTMQTECERVASLFPNPERIDKVEESMNNLLDVIKERDRAVKLLETGITGEPPTMECYGFTGLRHRYTYQEHLMPWWRNPKYFPKRYVQEKAHGMMREFVLKFTEKKLKERFKAKSKEMGIIHAALREYPNDPFWATVEGKDMDQISLKDVYHSKMSD